MTKEKMTAETVRVSFLISDASGVYIPQIFGKMFTDGNICNRKGEEDEKMTEMVSGFADREPYENENYWDDWTYVLDNVCIYSEGDNGMGTEVWNLHQDGDLRAINDSDLSELDDMECDKFWNMYTC